MICIPSCPCAQQRIISGPCAAVLVTFRSRQRGSSYVATMWAAFSLKTPERGSVQGS
jgi:hypothetical protein